MDRRNFLKATSLLGAGALILPDSWAIFQPTEMKKVRLGFIAVGMRVQTHVEEDNYWRMGSGTEVIAFIDLDTVQEGLF